MKIMSRSNLLQKAKIKADLLATKKVDPRYKRAIQWLCFTGLLQNNKVVPRNVRLSMSDLLYAAKIEPRVLELLPAILLELKDVLPFEIRKLPQQLAAVLEAIKNDQTPSRLFNIVPREYLQWFGTPALKLARRRLGPRSAPRLQQHATTSIGEAIRQGRQELGFTQVSFSQTFGTSLRALRDLEQGATHVSIARVNSILKIFNKRLRVAVQPNR